jgi:hypothetical protein
MSYVLKRGGGGGRKRNREREERDVDGNCPTSVTLAPTCHENVKKEVD